jgi:GntR family transcriptional regulator of arabinose operon
MKKKGLVMDNKPKYQEVKEYIIDYIRSHNLQANDPISSETEFVKLFALSRHTVRRAISDLVNEGWLYKEQGKGTFVAEPLVEEENSSKLIGLITTYINDYIFPEIIHGVEETLSEKGYTLLLGNTNNKSDKERMVLKNMLNNKPAGLIIEPTRSAFFNPNKDLYEEIKKRGIPILFIHASYPNIEASYVKEDDRLAGYMATKYLMEEGHKKIAGIFKEDDRQGHGRYEGYKQAHQEAAIDMDQEHILWYTSQNGEQLLSLENKNQLIKILHHYSGLVVYNDQIAAKLLLILKALDIQVPLDLSIVSFDNGKVAESSFVKLTTIAHPKAKLGREAAKKLLQLMDEPTNIIQEVMKPELIIRDSVRRIQ